MKIVATENYLEVVRTALASVESIEDAASAARAVATARQGIEELRLRRSKLLGVARERLERGIALADALYALLPSSPALAARHETVAAASRRAMEADFDTISGGIESLSQFMKDGVDGQHNEDRTQALSAWLRSAAEWEYGYYAALADGLRADEPAADRAGPHLTRESLQAFIRSRVPDAEHATIGSFRLISGGMGKNTYIFDMDMRAGERRDYVVRKAPPVPIASRWAYGIGNEFVLLGALYRAGLPVPEPIVANLDPASTDTPYFVMPKMPGVTPADFFAPLIEITDDMIGDLATVLASVHSVPLEQLTDYISHIDSEIVLNETVSECYRRRINEWKRYAEDEAVAPSLMLSYVIDWLLVNLPEDDRSPVLTHGDGNLHNVLVDQGRITALIDWEIADFGAPEQDLAYLQRQLETLTDWPTFLDRYETAAGRPLRRDTIRFYTVYIYMRLMITSLFGTRQFTTLVSRDARLIEIEQLYIPLIMRVILSNTEQEPVVPPTR